MNQRPKLIVLLVLVFSLSIKAQVNPGLQKAWDRFDFSLFEKEFNEIAIPSLDEMTLYARILYKKGDIKTAEKVLLTAKSKGALSNLGTTLLTDIQSIKTSASKQVLFQVYPLKLNTSATEFVAGYYDSTLYFSADKNKDLVVRATDIWTKKPFLDVFKTIVDKGHNSKVSKFYSTKFNDGPIAIFEDEIALTRNNSNALKKNLKVDFLGKKNVGFQYNNKNYSVGHFTYSITGDTIVFASDMDNKDGITDLYVCKREGASWSQPKRLGPHVNSPGKEMFPRIIGSNLYFSSNGWAGSGMLDIYKVNWLDTNAVPFAMPFPINTDKDDFGLVSLDGGVSGYFSSNRGAGGDDDIFYFNKSVISFGCAEKCDDGPCVQFEVEDFQEFDRDRFVFKWDMGDGTLIESPYVSYCYKDTGVYTINLSFYDKLEDDLRDSVISEEITITSMKKNLAEFKIAEEVTLGDSLKVETLGAFFAGDKTSSYWELDGKYASSDKLLYVNADGLGYKKVVRHVKIGDEKNCCYQNYSDYTYVKSASNNNTIDVVVAENIDITNPENFVNSSSFYPVRIIVLTEDGKETKFKGILKDAQGNIVWQEQISDAQTVFLDIHKTYTLEGTSADGELTKVLITSDGKTEEEFAYQEFYLVQKKPQYLVRVTNTKGEILSGVNIVVKGDTLGKTDANGLFKFSEKAKGNLGFVKHFYLEETISSNKLKQGEVYDVVLTRLSANLVIRLDNIYFDLGKSNIRPDAAQELNKLVQLMKEYPTLEIELSAHTDCRGSAPSNMSLSDRRAKSSAAYIISKGIAPSRLVGKGYGETKLLNKCADGIRCSEKEHQWNRRVECVILKM